MQVDEFVPWVDGVFAALPVGNEPFFKELWNKGKLKYDTTASDLDLVDQCNAKLSCTALESHQPTLIVLPDARPHRGAIIFTTALLKSSVRAVERNEQNHKVLYFGTSLSFKHFFSKTTVKNISLEEVFTYTQVTGADKSKTKKNDTKSTSLPEVICVLHPTHPEEFVKIHNPDWIAIDCGREGDVPWLNELLVYCKKKNKPVIGWSQNRFSTVVKTFTSLNCNVFFSPRGSAEKRGIGEYFVETESRAIQPLIFQNAAISALDSKISTAKSLLRQLSNENSGKLTEDSLKVAWLYLRTLERLTIPIAIYNEECKFFRYVHSTNSLSASLRSYIEHTKRNHPTFSVSLNRFMSIVQEIEDFFGQHNPPYWSVLSEYCTDRSKDGSLRVLVFPKRHQKHLFTYTLLSKFNISEDELLNDSRIVLRTLREFANPSQTDQALYDQYKLSPLVVGLPDLYNQNLFYELLNKWNLDVIIYPHQFGVARAIINDFNKLEAEQKIQSVETLRHLTNKLSQAPKAPNTVPRYALTKQMIEIKIGEGKLQQDLKDVNKALLQIGDMQTEVAKILEQGERDEEDADKIMSLRVSSGHDEVVEESVMCEEVVEVRLQDNYEVLVAPDEQINILKDRSFSQVFIRALRPGDRIVLIENQSRQSLYDLIIDRLHNHPSLELHLGFLKKWRSDFHIGYTKWRLTDQGNDIQGFLTMLQKRGSKITSPLTIANWVGGFVMSPQDSKDIVRIGEILNLKFLKENHSRIDAAAGRIAGLHISLSRKLNDWIESTSSNRSHHRDSELVDPELGLTFGELRSSIKILTVESIKQVHRPTLRSRLGQLNNLTK